MHQRPSARVLLRALACLFVVGIPRAQQAAPECDARSSWQPITVQGTELGQVHFQQPYGRHPCQTLDAYLVDSPEPAPVLVDVHGGGWSGGRKSTFYYSFDPNLHHHLTVARALEAGISIVSIDYRLAAQKDGCCKAVKDPNGDAIPEFAHIHPVPLDDVSRAIQFVRAMGRQGYWNIDPDRVAGVGTSAGANLLLQASLTPDRALPSSPDPIARESTHLDCVLSIAAPTLLTPDTWWSCPGPAQLPEQWVFGGNHPVSFNTDPSLNGIKLSMSPTWLAAQPPPVGVGSATVAITPILSIYGGDPTWTAASFFNPPDPCATTPADPLWRPTPNLHSPLHGILLHDELRAQGSTVSRLLVDPKGSCTGLSSKRSDITVDFAGLWLGQTPFQGLSHLDPGKLGLNGLHPEIGAYGRIRPNGQATLWSTDAPPDTQVTLAWSQLENPQPFLGATLWPDAGTAIFTPLPPTSDCGHLRWSIPPGFLPVGTLTAQLLFHEPGNTFDTLVSAPFRLTVEP